MPAFKETNLGGNDVEHLDSTTLLYSNFKYGFSMDFPDNWEIDRGVAQHTIIRAGQRDSVLLAFVNVIELKDVKEDISVWSIWDNKSLKFEESYKASMEKTVNEKLINFKYRKVHINNRESIETKFSYIVKEVDIEYEMQCLFYSVYKIPFTYTIGFKIPKFLYDENPIRYNYMINNFIFLSKK